ncbi:MAG: NYN domain-containing protein [Acidobacteria bacterium]|nr:NYN domain-containing protein [Acidobacteriota bacterium]
MGSETKVGVYVDVENMARNGGYGMRYDILREFASRGGADPVRLNAYVAFDYGRAQTDHQYKENAFNFHSALRDFGYKVIQKPVKWFTDEAGQPYAKANADLDMAVDALLQSEKLDRVLLATGDGDFVQVVRALQNRGCRVEAVAFNNVSSELRREADLYMSGFLIPSLLPGYDGPQGSWGEEGSRVRGVCYSYSHDRSFGFLRFMREIASGLWNIDTRRAGSPYSSAFAHQSEFPDEIDLDKLPSRDYIFEFTLFTSERGLQAKDLTVVKHL